MAFSTIEALAGRGRVIVGLGLSGPQIVEGWYGTPWAKPIARTRDTVAIMRQVFAREGPVAYDGEAISLPYDGPDATGVGKPLKSILHTNPDMPIFIAAGGPANVALTAEIADGWLPMGLTPSNAAHVPADPRSGRRALGSVARHARDPVGLRRADHRRRRRCASPPRSRSSRSTWAAWDRATRTSTRTR